MQSIIYYSYSAVLSGAEVDGALKVTGEIDATGNVMTNPRATVEVVRCGEFGFA